MLDIKFIRSNPDDVRSGLKLKGDDSTLEPLLKLDASRRALIEELDALKARRNKLSAEIGKRAKAGEDISALKEESREVGDKVTAGDEERRRLETEIHEALLRLPNLPHPSAPEGHSEAGNRFVREWGACTVFDFTPKDHLELGDALGVFDFPRGSKITGSGFPVYRGAGAILERALINFMLDEHCRKGIYEEISVPFVVNRDSLTGTGQLPKFEEDLYHCNTDDLFLIPTAEVPITNYHRDEMFSEEDLPIRYCGYSPCFRREAGSYGKETRGFLRVHQFDKVELVKFVTPETSYDELESLVKDATEILEALGVRYRIMELCAGDLSFSAAKCYDIEVWAPVEKKWLEASSCSNFEAYQARRANIRYRPKGKGKPEYLHTLNGSGLATSRLLVALMEANQNDDGTVSVPDVLKKYTGFSLITPDGPR